MNEAAPRNVQPLLDALPNDDLPDMKSLIQTVELQLAGRQAAADPLLVKYLQDRPEVADEIRACIDLENLAAAYAGR